MIKTLKLSTPFIFNKKIKAANNIVVYANYTGRINHQNLRNFLCSITTEI